MSPTLADVYMITNLKVTGTVYPYKYKGSSKQTGIKTGVGYKRYIQNHISDGCDNPPRKIPYYRLRPIHFGH
jgi:hypothetical protein